MDIPKTAAHALTRRDEAIVEAHRQYRRDLLELRNVSSVRLGTRATNAIRYIFELSLTEPEKIAKVGRKEFLKVGNLGRKSVNEIEFWLFQRGYELLP